MLVESCCNSRLLLLLLLQLNGEIRGEQHLLLLLKQMKVSLHHHFVNGRIPPSATPVLAWGRRHCLLRLLRRVIIFFWRVWPLVWVVVTLVHHKVFIIALSTLCLLVIRVNKVVLNRRAKRWTLVWIPLLVFFMIEGTLVTSLAPLRLPPFDDTWLFKFFLRRRILLLVIDIARIRLILERMIEPFICGVRFFTFKTERAPRFIRSHVRLRACITLVIVSLRWVLLRFASWFETSRSFLSNHSLRIVDHFAVIRCINILIRGPSVILKFVCIDTWHVVVSQVLFRAVRCLVAVHVKCVFV